MYARFWALFNRIETYGEKEEAKAAMVSSYTCGRTTHLHEMTRAEYEHMCYMMEHALPKKGQPASRTLRQLRSRLLHQMQLLGVDTADWNAVDRFCLDRRIAGKRFCKLDGEELRNATVKCLVIKRKETN